MSRRKRQRPPVDPYSVERAQLRELGLALATAPAADPGEVKPLLAEFIAAEKAEDTNAVLLLRPKLDATGVTIEGKGEGDVDDTPPLDFTPKPGVPQPDEGTEQGIQVANPHLDEVPRAEAEEAAAELDEGEQELPPEWEEELEPLRPPGAVPDLDEPPVFPLGPLAAAIQMQEALLEQAKGGYISERVEQLEAVLREEFGPEDRMLIADYASRFRDGMGLPDVSGAYEQLVARRAEEVRAAEGADEP